MHNDVPIPIRFGIRAVVAVLLAVLMAQPSADPAIARIRITAPTPPLQSSAVGSWSQLVYTNTGPSPRYDHAAILDPVRNQLVVFGGRGSGTLGDTWALDMATQAWREITSTTKPAPRFGHGAVYDASNRRMLVVMGEGSAFFNDVWSFNLDSEVWTELKASVVISTSPAPRYGQSAALDSQGRLLISHGFTTQGRFDDTWAFDPSSATWIELTPTSGTKPIKRCLHSLAYDAASNRLFMFGGCASGFGPCPLNDLWAFDLQNRTWTQLSALQSASDVPAARSNPSMVLDATTQQLVVMGGQAANGASADAWGFGLGGAWRKLTDAGEAAPAGRASHTASEDVAQGRMWVFGGRTANGLSNELWAWQFWPALYLPAVMRPVD
jgi:Galactose oxidase, central domain